MIKAFISHSSKQKEFALELVNELGRDYCKIDCYNFSPAYKSIDEIYNSIENSTIFVLLISKESLESDWVQTEVYKAKETFKQNNYERFWPYIIDESIQLQDCPTWMKDDECFNLTHFKSPYILARDIEQKFRRIIWANNPQLKTIETTMVGRNEDIARFEDKYQSCRGMNLRALFISGREGVGKDTFAKQCLYKIGYSLEQIPYTISMGSKDNIENFIIYLNIIARNYTENELKYILNTDPKAKAKVAVELLNMLYETKSVVFVEDNMACILPTRDIPEWLADIIEDENLNNQLGLFIKSRIAPNSYLEANHPKIASISLQPLDRKEREKLFYNYIRTYEITGINEDDVNFFVDKLLQSPFQIWQAVDAIKNKSLIAAKKDIDKLIKIGDNKLRPLLDRYHEEEQRHLLIIMSRFDFISYELLEKIFEERIKEVLEYLFDMINYNIVTSFGASDNFYRLDHYLSDYIRRNQFSLPRDLEVHINDILENQIKDANNITKDTSLYLYDIKNRIMKGHALTDDFLIPSVIVKSIIDIYNKGNYNHVINLCDKVLKDYHNFYSDVTRELTYWLCLSLCRTQNETRFYEEIKIIDGADKDFLIGLYHRIAKEYQRAESFFKKALNKNPSMQRAKRELVTVLLAQRHYQEALSHAQDNYKHNAENTYHIHAYFRCLIKKTKLNKEDITILEELMSGIEQSYSNKKDELLAAMNIEFNAYALHKTPSEILTLIQNAEKSFPSSINIQRASHEYKYKQALVTTDMFFDEDLYI